MLVGLENNAELRLAARVALDHDLVAGGVQMLLDLHAELDLLALRARQALFWAILIEMLLQLCLRELLGLRALVRALEEPSFALPLQMLVQLLIADRLLAPMRLIWAPELQQVQLLLIELVDLAGRRCEALAAILLVAGVVDCLGAALTNYVLA